MGFRKDAFATVWSVEPYSERLTRGRISVSHKNIETGQYEEDFGGFVAFAGAPAAQKALPLQRLDRIQLGDVDVTTKYDRERDITYTNFNIYSFEILDKPSDTENPETTDEQTVDDGEVNDENLPF